MIAKKQVSQKVITAFERKIEGGTVKEKETLSRTGHLKV